MTLESIKPMFWYVKVTMMTENDYKEDGNGDCKE